MGMAAPTRGPGPLPRADTLPRTHRLFGIKCAKCQVGFSSSDLVMRARDSVYHIECFRCSVCSRQLLPGDEFSLREHELLCRADHGLLLERAAATSPGSPGPLPARGLHLSGEPPRAKARVRAAGAGTKMSLMRGPVNAEPPAGDTAWGARAGQRLWVRASRNRA